MVEIDIKEHYIFKTLLLAAAKDEEIVIKHRDYPKYRLHIGNHLHARTQQGQQQPSVARLSLSDIEALLGHPVVIVPDNPKTRDTQHPTN